jgi:hypothetical protein
MAYACHAERTRVRNRERTTARTDRRSNATRESNRLLGHCFHCPTRLAERVSGHVSNNNGCCLRSLFSLRTQVSISDSGCLGWTWQSTGLRLSSYSVQYISNQVTTTEMVISNVFVMPLRDRRDATHIIGAAFHCGGTLNMTSSQSY